MKSLTKEYNKRYMENGRDGLRLAWIEKAVNDVDPVSEEDLMQHMKANMDDGR